MVVYRPKEAIPKSTTTPTHRLLVRVIDFRGKFSMLEIEDRGLSLFTHLRGVK